MGDWPQKHLVYEGLALKQVGHGRLLLLVGMIGSRLAPKHGWCRRLNPTIGRR